METQNIINFLQQSNNEESASATNKWFAIDS